VSGRCLTWTCLASCHWTSWSWCWNWTWPVLEVCQFRKRIQLFFFYSSTLSYGFLEHEKNSQAFSGFPEMTEAKNEVKRGETGVCWLFYLEVVCGNSGCRDYWLLQQESIC
jgi:hypothetical protein